jgi:hypothetical protein
MGRESQLLTHGVDLMHWQQPVAAEVPELAGLERPLFLYWGVVDRRTDAEYVLALGRTLTEQQLPGTILFVGPQDLPEPALMSAPRVASLPPWPYARLPELANQARVLIAPYADIPATRAMQPLKLKEYLATGKPVVVRKLPATESWADCADVVASPDEFARSVLMRSAEGLATSQLQARKRLLAESWAGKAEQFYQWVVS